MDYRRLIPLLVFSFSLIMLWEAWTQHNRPAVTTPAAVSAQTDPNAPGSIPVPSAALTPTPSDVPTVPGSSSTVPAQNIPAMTVTTDLFQAQISAQGGDIVRMDLKNYQRKDHPDQMFILLDNGQHNFYNAQTGLIGANLPNHKTFFNLPESELSLKEGEDTLEVRLQAPEQNGISVSRIMTFHRGSYLVDVKYEIHNASGEAIAPHAYFQFVRDSQPAETVEGFGVHTYTGPAFYTEAEKYRKIDFSDIEKGKATLPAAATDGWAAMIQHYFVGAWLPEAGVQREFFTRKIGPGIYSAGVIVPATTIQPGQTGTIESRLYLGPQEQEKLKSIAPKLELVVDYGWLTIIAAPLFWVLSWFYQLTGNWGWAIVLVTITIKLIFFPLSAASYKSMAKMRVLAPRLQRLKEMYGNDKAKMQQEMMSLYRNEKINPLGGCLPILVQIPVFISLYWVLLNSVEMRQAPWIWWIHDLSAKDPYFILPIIMGVSMIIQTKLNPTPPDPIQAKVMMAMPIIFSVMFLWFPSGLVLYWVVNNLLSIAQQWQITRMIEGEKATAKKNT